jgi:ABC-type molybdate transport system ATPase subunit
MSNYEINRLKNLLESKKNELKHYQERNIVYLKDLKTLRVKLAFFSKVLETKLEEKTNIENILTQLNNEVFDKEDQIKIELTYDKDESLKGIKLLVSSDGINFGNILDTYGEGEVTVVIIVLNILLLMVNDSVPKFVVFDEPFAFLNKSKQSRINDFISSIVENTGCQIILLTHQDDLIGKVISVTKKQGTSYVSEQDKA